MLFKRPEEDYQLYNEDAHTLKQMSDVQLFEQELITPVDKRSTTPDL